ncbi:MAG TPA: hypothetical protein VKY45_03525 [Marinilabiliaceae bacterium]|nr:hypothetical protein [Marinilabiliaceae bacterium]
METILDRLKKYFKNTSLEQVKEDWKKTESYDLIDSPSAESFIFETKRLIDVGKHANLPPESFINNFENPNFSSDFFLI